MKRLLFVFAAIGVSVALVPATAGADVDLVKTITVTKPGGNYSANPVVVVLNPQNCQATSDVVFFFNDNTGGNIRIRNTTAPGVNQFPDQNVPNNGTSTGYAFCCDSDVGVWEFTIDDGSGAGSTIIAKVIVKCPRQVPATTPLGMTILILMLLAVAGWVLLKRRPQVS